MTLRRLHLPLPETLTGVVPLAGPALHYIRRVLRLEAGDALEVFDGRGRAVEGCLEQGEGQAMGVRLGQSRNAPVSQAITVVQALPKGDKLEWVLQKGTELGAIAFSVVDTERTVVRLSPERAAARVRRWQQVAAEAARQCGRSDVPHIEGPAPLAQALSQLDPATAVFVLVAEPDAPRLAAAWARLSGRVPLALVVGPEGGLSPDEVGRLKAAGASAVGLGPWTLRTETAALAALAVLRHCAGELG